MKVAVDGHALKHGLSEQDIRHAWEHFLRKQPRIAPDQDRIIAVGVTSDGSLVQMVAVASSIGVLIYHAMTPPTKSFLKELGLARRKR